MSSDREIASGAWTRLRNLIGALDRLDRLETSSEFESWLPKLAADEEGLSITIREFLLMAVRVAVDAVNWRVLVLLIGSGPAESSTLARELAVSRVELVERTNELARMGLTTQALEGGMIDATPFARGLAQLIEDWTIQVKTLASNDYIIKAQMAKSKLADGQQ